MTPDADPISAYLAELAARLPACPGAGDLLDETRDHLLEAADRLSTAGGGRHEAERAAVADFGAVARIVPEFEVLVELRESRRLEGRMLVAGALLVGASLAVYLVGPLLTHQSLGPDAVPGRAFARVATAAAIAALLGLIVLGHRPALWFTRERLPWLAAATGLAGGAFVLSVPLLTALLVERAGRLAGAPWPGWLVAGALGGLVLARIAAAPAFAAIMRNRRRMLARPTGLAVHR